MIPLNPIPKFMLQSKDHQNQDISWSTGSNRMSKWVQTRCGGTVQGWGNPAVWDNNITRVFRQCNWLKMWLSLELHMDVICIKWHLDIITCSVQFDWFLMPIVGIDFGWSKLCRWWGVFMTSILFCRLSFSMKIKPQVFQEQSMYHFCKVLRWYFDDNILFVFQNHLRVLIWWILRKRCLGEIG